MATGLLCLALYVAVVAAALRVFRHTSQARRDGDRLEAEAAARLDTCNAILAATETRKGDQS
jgi:hypothetical protein